MWSAYQPSRWLRPVCVAGLIAFVAFPCAGASDLQVFRETRFVADTGNDGDSFLVDWDGKPQRIRLYFVDCPETTVDANTDAQRVREQARYFGIDDPKQVIQLGKQAGAFTAEALRQPFQVVTGFATAGGRSQAGRVYAFVTTADGRDLAALLVENGLARVYGVGRELPDGTSREEQFAQLRDLEAAAMMKRRGLWAASNPDRLAELRKAQRREDQELLDLKESARDVPSARGPVDLNTASREELQTLPGIGPVLAGRIIAARPFRSVKDLQQVPGISPAKYQQLAPRIVVNPE